MAKVRHGTATDWPQLLAMGRDMRNESPRFAAMDYDDDKVIDLFAGLSAGPNGLVLVADGASGPVGMLLGFAAEHFFGHSITASELVVYVAPHARGGSTAVKLLRAFEDWAVERRASEIVLGVSTEVHAERTAQFYNRLGFERSGFTVRKTL